MIGWFQGIWIGNRPIFFLVILFLIIGVQFFSIGLLGELFIKDSEDNQISINETLMEEGHAYSYHGEKKKKYENK